MEDDAMAKGMLLKGRQLVFLVHDWFKLNPDMKPLYGIRELSDLAWMGDAKIFEFLDLQTTI